MFIVIMQFYSAPHTSPHPYNDKYSIKTFIYNNIYVAHVRGGSDILNFIKLGALNFIIIVQILTFYYIAFGFST